MNEFVFTSESVSEGHPDKVCDQISDAIVDAYLLLDPRSRTAVETVATTNHVSLLGEINSSEKIDNQKIDEIVRGVVKNIGYEQQGFDWQKLKVDILLHEQSADIAMGVDKGTRREEGAGDQGIMFGYAVNETPAFMPAAIFYAHKILSDLSRLRHSGEIQGLGPDAKSQVSLRYVGREPVEAKVIVLSTQHHPDVSQKNLRDIVIPQIEKSLPRGLITDKTIIHINPTGRFVIGGPDGDAGLTGRKIIVDTYGGAAPHGGGAFSGKDPSKVDRSAAYMARYLAKNVVAAGLAQRCTIQLSYAIGLTDPTSFYVNTHGTGLIDSRRIEKKIKEIVSLTPSQIRYHLKLHQPIYTPTASYGHFGRTPKDSGEFSWEKLDMVEVLRSEFL